MLYSIRSCCSMVNRLMKETCFSFMYICIFLQLAIEEKNRENYLSAGEMPLPALYFMMSLLFFLSGCFWVFILHKSK
jgi:hypothetical protein